MPPLDQAARDRIAAEAKRRGIDPAKAIAAAEKVAPAPKPDNAPPAADVAKPAHPVADRLLVGFLPFIKVHELRAIWLGLPDRIDDDEMTCGDYQAAHGGIAGAPAPADPPA